ncbi:hypothetical protein GY15_20640 [Delftia sp. 670]|nr:hypothetical protein GY15_20640 [Delftia sp. 670]
MQERPRPPHRLRDANLLLGHVEGEQIEQVVVGGRGLHGKEAALRLIAGQVLDAAQAGNVAEQFLDGLGHLQTLQRTDQDVQRTAATGGCRSHGAARYGRGRRGRLDRRCHGSRRRCRCSGRGGCCRHGTAAFCQHLDARHQIRGGQGLALVAGLVACQQAAAGIGRLQQHVDHFRNRCDLMPAQPVEQRLHAVRQLGHIGKAEGGRAALDRVRATENAVELLVVGRRQIQIQQHLLHLVEVLGRFFEEDLIELAQVEVCARSCPILV